MKIDKRDIKIFLLGMLTMFIIELIVEWKDFVKGFNEGLNGQKESNK